MFYKFEGNGNNERKKEYDFHKTDTLHRVRGYTIMNSRRGNEMDPEFENEIISEDSCCRSSTWSNEPSLLKKRKRI